MNIVIGRSTGENMSSAEAYRTSCIRDMLDMNSIYIAYEKRTPVCGKFLFVFESLMLNLKVLWHLMRNKDVRIISQVNIVTLLGLWFIIHVFQVKVIFDFCERPDNYKYRTGVGLLYRLKGRLAESIFQSFYLKAKFLCISNHLIKLLPRDSSKLFLPVLFNEDVHLSSRKRIISERQNCGKIKVVFAGTIDFEKDGSNLLVSAVMDILMTGKANERAIELHILGDGKDLLTLKTMVPIEYLESSIFFYGRVSREKMLNILSICDISVLPRLKSSQAEGGFPTKLIDYWSESTAMIIFPVGEVRNYLEENRNCIILEEISKEAIYSAVLKLVNDIELRNLLSREGSLSVFKHFGISKHRNRVNKFLNRDD